ncbi:MAG TPA: hypothetical protein VG939_05535, partial [Caulobacteraceae bacterium]|nr:hypothetical protein [Caulobacteraceae bacterium]
MSGWMRGCAVAAMLAAMGGQALAEVQGGFVRSVPVHEVGPLQDGPELFGEPGAAAPAVSTSDTLASASAAAEPAEEAQVALPAGVREGTLDAQLVRLRVNHPDAA